CVRSCSSRYVTAQIFSSTATSAAPVPATFSRLIRALAPATKATSRGAMPSVLATSWISAAFASPSLAAARTRAFSTLRPSAIGSTPSIASRPPLGVSRTTSARPPASTCQGRGSGLTSRPRNVRSDKELEIEPNDQAVEKHQPDDQDQGRNVDTAETGQNRADRTQGGLGDLIEEIPDHPNRRVVGVQDVECDQP